MIPINLTTFFYINVYLVDDGREILEFKCTWERCRDINVQNLTFNHPIISHDPLSATVSRKCVGVGG